MDAKLIIGIVSAAISIGCYLDNRRMRIALKKELQRMGAAKQLLVTPTFLGQSHQIVVAVVAAVVAVACFVLL